MTIPPAHPRYGRQTILPCVGDAGQDRLRRARLLVVGAGGLGAPALPYLAGAGVGRITLLDPDTVAEHNLHRQTLYRMADIGAAKVEAAAKTLQALNPQVEIRPIVDWLDPANAPALIGESDLVLDCADNFAVSYTLSDACKALGRPLISASALALSGYVGGFCGGAPSLRAVFPDLPQRAPNCDAAGVLGPVVGTLGTLQAQMALSVLLGLEPSPLGAMLTMDFSSWRISRFRFDNAGEPATDMLRFVAPSQITPDDLAVDLRSTSEAPRPTVPHALRLDVAGIAGLPLPKHGQRVVMCCRTGLRAWHAAQALQKRWDGDVVVSAMGDRP